jgi:hypothetical protein
MKTYLKSNFPHHLWHLLLIMKPMRTLKQVRLEFIMDSYSTPRIPYTFLPLCLPFKVIMCYPERETSHKAFKDGIRTVQLCSMGFIGHGVMEFEKNAEKPTKNTKATALVYVACTLCPNSSIHVHV